MAVRNPYTEGGTLPEAGEPPIKKPGQKDPLDKVLDMKAKIAASKQLDSLIQEPQPASPSTPPFSFTGHFDLGQVITSAQNAVTEMQKQNAAIMSDAQKERFQMLQGQLSDMKAKLDSSVKQPDAQQQNPLQAYREVRGMLTELSGELRSELGLSSARASPSDINSLLELKKMDLDYSTRDRQWQSEEKRKEREFNFQMKKWDEEHKAEERRWLAEFNQKKTQLDQDRETRTKTMDIFSDFAQAAAEGIDFERAQELPSPGTRTSSGDAEQGDTQGAPMQMFFKCLNDGCGAEIPVEAGSNKLVCPSCKSEYVRKKSLKG